MIVAQESGTGHIWLVGVSGAVHVATPGDQEELLAALSDPHHVAVLTSATLDNIGR